ncbi:hypothetical protein OK016_13935 [Vibrio chagasii]|nr:hypothetical protein [Vibrio chagasii]
MPQPVVGLDEVSQQTALHRSGSHCGTLTDTIAVILVDSCARYSARL